VPSTWSVVLAAALVSFGSGCRDKKGPEVIPEHFEAAPSLAGFGTDELAAPGSAPHYFGPHANWANSPFRMADALVEIVGGGGSGATAKAQVDVATGAVFAIDLVDPGFGYSTIPTVQITSVAGGGSGAAAVAAIDALAGTVKSITVTSRGSGYLTRGIRKFVDTLPGLDAAGANNLGQYIPVAVPDTTTYPGSDYYEIAVVEFLEKMHSDLPPTKLRGYVQLSTSVVPGRGVALRQLDGNFIRLPGDIQALAVDDPHFLGPAIVATKDRPVRILFRNLLPTGAGGDLFLPVDTTVMGSGMGPEMVSTTNPLEMMAEPDPRKPMCGEQPKPRGCYTENRATLHLHGGVTPWISDGTPHQWITPANEDTPYPQGVSVRSVPDMDPQYDSSTDGAMTFFYTNQQSARLMFYHDHSWGITRLNVYAGEAAAYVIEDATEKALVSSGIIPGPADTIPLVIQDRTFVPSIEQVAVQDPTWNPDRWGGEGSFWYHHVYMPAQNPGDPGGMSAFGRWMYGPWFWPPATDAKYGPIANPNFDPACSLDDPTTWQYQTDPFCEPELIPGTPNLSAGMEQFNDTPIVNGTAYPTVTLQPRPYRLRILNAANDRFWNLQWYVADGTGTEVALNAAEVAAAQEDPVVFPTPDTVLSPPGPDWIQIGTEGGFLPAPAVIPAQPITWITDPTRFDVGNVDQHSLVVAPAERADVVVDFSKFAGKTLILYNDAPAAFPARVSSYDYYTGAPDLSPVGAPGILPGYGPNTRTIMQVKIAASAPVAFDLAALQAAFAHHQDGSGVFESGQHPIVVGQAAYNSAYGTSFAASGWCSSPTSTFKCDGYARINQQGGEPFTFDTLPSLAKLSIPLQPKAIHDEMNASSFDDYGRMQANLGLEIVPATPGNQNVVLYAYTSPMTELIDATFLPTTAGTGAVAVTPIASAADGTQIWKITHNGVDTHPIHFHAYDVQLINRVTWDNIVIPPDANELGWKDTVRISPLEDTLVAIRPVLPELPFDVPNSIRLLNPAMPEGAMLASATLADQIGIPMTSFNPAGEPVDIVNHYVNFGAEYVYHCHILSHEEMDMMRSVSLAIPPKAPSDFAFDPAALTTTFTWFDHSVNETAFAIEKSVDAGLNWAEVARLERLTPDGTLVFDPSLVGTVTFEPQTAVTAAAGDLFRVSALNVVGDAWNYADPAINEIVSGGFPTVTPRAASETITR
jgi:FtsP/CotA-like multicopper oxidase with cupredoxin domain